MNSNLKFLTKINSKYIYSKQWQNIFLIGFLAMPKYFAPIVEEGHGGSPDLAEVQGGLLHLELNLRTRTYR